MHEPYDCKDSLAGSMEIDIHYAGVTQWLECHVANVDVVGSSPTTRSI